MSIANEISDETLAAFIDGELPEVQRRRVEAALRRDPALAARAEAFRTVDRRVKDAFANVADEPVPDRLQRLLAEAPGAGAGNVADLEHARARRAAPPARFGWPQFGAIAASVVVGVLIGRAGLESDTSMIRTADGGLRADGALADALTTLTSVDEGPVRIAMSFRDANERYCRVFAAPGERALTGVACRGDEHWNIEILAPTANGSDARGMPGAFRLAGTMLHPQVLGYVDEALEGEALDEAAERAAIEGGWRE